MQDNDDFLEFIDYAEDVQEIVRIPKRYIRDKENPVEFYSEKEFRSRYRFSKAMVVEVLLPLIVHRFVRVNNRGLPISPLIQLLTCLRFYATGSFQVSCFCVIIYFHNNDYHYLHSRW